MTEKIKQMLQSSDADMVCLGVITLFQTHDVKYDSFLYFSNYHVGRIIIIHGDNVLYNSSQGIYVTSIKQMIDKFPFSYRTCRKIIL